MSCDFVDFTDEVIPCISIFVDLPILPPSWVAKKKRFWGSLDENENLFH